MRDITVLLIGLLTAAIGTNTASAQTGYAIGENAATANTGPVRLARISYMTGPVTWRPNDSTQWSSASMNLPFRQGAQIWVKNSSRAELQFDDGSTMRLGGGAVAILQTMFSDDQGEFTEIKLNEGLATFHLRIKQSEYQIDTPLSSVKASGPAEIRLGVGASLEVSCTGGTAELSGRQGRTTIHPRERIQVRDQTAPYTLASVPDPDQWDRFNDSRNLVFAHHNQHVPDNIGMVSGNLDNYGTWHNDPRHGYVWAPRVHESNWRPYRNGRWVWVSPWGWTWVGDEDWGYAPYHYGTWLHASYGWAWSPGPRVQYWSPGVVAYVDNGSSIGWAPLGPSEVVYPASIGIGFRSGDWSLSFSIGGAAAYYPSSSAYCVARPWDNSYANGQINIYGGTSVTNIYNGYGQSSGGVFVRNSRFIPQNGSVYAGMTMATHSAFLGGRGYQAPRADSRGMAFRNGRSFSGAPSRSQVFGPPGIRPNASSFTHSRTFAKGAGPTQSMLQRSVVRRGVPNVIATRSGTMRQSFASSNRQATVTRGPIQNRGQQLRSGTGQSQMNPGGRPMSINPRNRTPLGNTRNTGGRPSNLKSGMRMPAGSTRNPGGRQPANIGKGLRTTQPGAISKSQQIAGNRVNSQRTRPNQVATKSKQSLGNTANRQSAQNRRQSQPRTANQKSPTARQSQPRKSSSSNVGNGNRTAPVKTRAQTAAPRQRSPRQTNARNNGGARQQPARQAQQRTQSRPTQQRSAPRQQQSRQPVQRRNQPARQPQQRAQARPAQQRSAPRPQQSRPPAQRSNGGGKNQQKGHGG